MGVCCWWWVVLKMQTDSSLSYSLSWWLLSPLTIQQLYQGHFTLKAWISAAKGKQKVLYLRLLQVVFFVDCVQSEICAAEWDLCCRLGQALHRAHINGSLRCPPSLLGLVLFYPKVYQEMPELCHILWAESFWTFYKFILILLHLTGPTLCQDIGAGAPSGIW